MIIDSKFNPGDNVFMIKYKKQNQKQFWYVLDEVIIVDHIGIMLAGKMHFIKITDVFGKDGDISQFYSTKEEAEIECLKRNNLS